MNIDDIKKLRKETEVGVLDAKKALIKANGDYDEALRLLEEEGMEIAKKRTAKITKHSTIGYYIHTKQRIAVLVELACESDTTSTANFFTEFANDIAMHIAAKNCKYISKQDVPEDLIERMCNDFICEAENEGLSESGIELFVNEKIETYYQTSCLLEQRYYRDEDRTIHDIIMEFIYKYKENVEIKRFVSYARIMV